MPWFNEESIVNYDLDKAKGILDEAGWIDAIMMELEKSRI